MTPPKTAPGDAPDKDSLAKGLQRGSRFDVTQFGAVGNGYSTTGSISKGTNTLSVPSGRDWVVGQGIQVVGASAGGAAPLLTKIVSITGSRLTLADPALVSVSGAPIFSDDTEAIQAAFTECWNKETRPYGGVVEFPGGSHNYTISHTIYAYDSCSIEGLNGNNLPAFITWKGTNKTGIRIPFTTFTVAPNTSYFGPSSPVTKQPYSITIAAKNNLGIGNWVLIGGCSSSGTDINNTVAEVAAASGTSFTVVVPYVPTVRGTDLEDSCIATTTTVGIAFDANAHFQNEVKGIALWQPGSYPSSEKMGADIYFGSRIDTGSRINDTYADEGLYFDYYFADGGINVDFDKGWRADGGAKVAQVYWRLGAIDNFRMATGSLSTNDGASGAYLMLDNQGCNDGGGASGHFSFNNMTFEIDSPFFPGFGAITMLACPTFPDIQFLLHIESSAIACATAAATNCPSLAILNKDDSAIAVEYVNSVINQSFLNLPNASRMDLTGQFGYYPFTSYSYSGASFNAGGQKSNTAITQALTDFNFKQLWQDGVQASAFLYSDASFAALPNATTLTAGQIVAPPVYWAAGGSNKRYSLNVVTEPGTTGKPNYGVTKCVSAPSKPSTLSCSGPSAAISSTSCAANVLTVNTSNNTFAAGEQVLLIGTQESFLNGVNGGVVKLSAAGPASFKARYTCGGFTGNGSDTGTAVVSSTVDLSPNQFITIGPIKTYITSINTANPAAVLVSTRNSVSSITSPAALSYTAPVLGTEIQVLSKASSVPTSGMWSEGDYVENSNAKANGVAGWVNVLSGKPGTWAGIPLGNSAGQLNASQVSGSSVIGNGRLDGSATGGAPSGTGSVSVSDAVSGGSCSGCSARTVRTAQAFCVGTATPASILAMSGAGSATTSCTSAVGAGSGAQLLMTNDGSLSALTVRCAHSGISSSSGAFSVWDLPSGAALSGPDSGVNTGVTLTYGTAKADTALFDTTHAFSYSKGDLLRIQFSTQAGETLGDCEASFNY